MFTTTINVANNSNNTAANISVANEERGDLNKMLSKSIANTTELLAQQRELLARQEDFMSVIKELASKIPPTTH